MIAATNCKFGSTERHGMFFGTVDGIELGEPANSAEEAVSSISRYVAKDGVVKELKIMAEFFTRELPFCHSGPRILRLAKKIEMMRK